MNDGMWLRLHEERAGRLQAEAREPRRTRGAKTDGDAVGSARARRFTRYSGMTATPTSSTLARGSKSPATSKRAVAG
jgi:hypothetical protein